MEVTTVNFDDLFDFSPESVDPASPLQLQPLSPDNVPLVLRDNLNLDSSKLSQSVPSNWTGTGRSRSNVTSKSFDTSVGQLLEDLPGTGTDSGSSSTTGTKSKRGRKPGQTNLKTDMKSKLERSRQSARECRVRKKLRYQYLDDIIAEREKANIKLRNELLKYQEWSHQLDTGVIPDGLLEMVNQFKIEGDQ